MFNDENISQQDLLQKTFGVFDPVVVEDKTSILAGKVQEKLGLLQPSSQATFNSPILGTVPGQNFYDADSPFTPSSIKEYNAKNTMRLGDVESSIDNYVNAPEAPSTILKKNNREATDAERGAYQASMMAKDDYFIPAGPQMSPELYAKKRQDLMTNPMTDDEWQQYQNSQAEQYRLAKEQGYGDAELHGIQGNEGVHGRQVAQAYTQAGWDPEKSLQEHLLSTGSAQMYSHGKPVEQITSGNSNLTTEQRIQQEIERRNALRTASGAWDPSNIGTQFVAGFGRSAYDTAVDLPADIATGIYSRTTDGKMLDLTGTTEEKDAWEEAHGFGMSEEGKANNLAMQEHIKKAQENVDWSTPATYKNLDLGHVWEAVKYGFATPENAARSTGYLLPFMAGLLEKGAVKTLGLLGSSENVAKIGAYSTALKETEVALKAGKLTKEAAVAAEKAAFNDLSFKNKATILTSRIAPAGTYGAIIQNQSADQYYKENGELQGTEALLTGTMVNTIFGLFDISVSKDLLKGVTSADSFANLLNNVVKDKGKLAKISAFTVETLGKLAYGSSKEIPQEFIQSWGEGFTSKLNSDFSNIKEAAISKDTMQQALEGAASAPGVATHMATPGIAINAIGNDYVMQGLTAGKEYLADVMSNAANPNQVNQASTVAGRRTRWETIDNTYGTPENDFNIDPKAVPGYTNDIVLHVNDLLNDPKTFENSEYEPGQETKIIDDAIDKIARINGVNTEQGREAIAGELVNALDEFLSGSDKDGTAHSTEEQRIETLKKVQNQFPNNPYVNSAIENNFQKKLSEQFASWDQSNLDSTNLEALRNTIQSMKIMGSEQLTKTAESVEAALDAYQKLGSENSKLPPAKKKTLEQVADEVTSNGFRMLTGNNTLKSIAQHGNDLGLYVTGLNSNDLQQPSLQQAHDNTIKALETFVPNRGINKLKAINEDSGKLFNIEGIIRLAKARLNENTKLLDEIKKALSNENLLLESKQRLETLQESLSDNTNKHQELIELYKQGKDATLYRRLAGNDKTAVETQIKKNGIKDKGPRVQVEVSTAAEQVIEKPISKTEDKIAKAQKALDDHTKLMEDRIASGKDIEPNEAYELVSKQQRLKRELEDVKQTLPTALDVATKIFKGQKLTPADLQVQQNEGPEIERLLKSAKERLEAKKKTAPKEKYKRAEYDEADINQYELAKEGEVNEYKLAKEKDKGPVKQPEKKVIETKPKPKVEEDVEANKAADEKVKVDAFMQSKYDVMTILKAIEDLPNIDLIRGIIKQVEKLVEDC